MKIKDMPEWVLKHKTKGHTVRYQDGNFRLIKIESKRVKDKPYPVLSQEFVGIITKEGIKLKKTYQDHFNSDDYIEYGFSFFVVNNYIKELKRGIYASGNLEKDLIITAAIILYLFNDINEDYLKLTYISNLMNITDFKMLTNKRLSDAMRVKLKIDELLERDIKDKTDRNILIFKLKNTKINKLTKINNSLFSEDTIKIIERYGLNYGI